MNTTLSVLAATALLLIAYDVWVYYRKGADATISSQLLATAKMHPIVPFILGFILGHIFWQQ